MTVEPKDVATAIDDARADTAKVSATLMRLYTLVTGLSTDVHDALASLDAARTMFADLVADAAQPVPVPPVVTPAPETPPDGHIFVEDFDYQDTTELQRVYHDQSSGGENLLLLLDTGVVYNGHPTMKYLFPPQSTRTGQPRHNLTRPRRHVTFRGIYRFSPGWTTEGLIPTDKNHIANAYKWLAFGWAQGYTGRIDISFTNTSQIQCGLSCGTPDGIELFQSHTVVTNKGARLWDGDFWTLDVDVECVHDQCLVTVNVRNSTNSTQFMAEIPPVSTKDARDCPPIDVIKLGSNFNQTRRADQQQSLWLCEYTVTEMD